MKTYDLHPQASADLLDLHSFIAEDSLESADKAFQAILNKFDQIAQMPYIGHIREDLAEKPMRFARVNEYLIAYVPDRNPLRILAVVHGRRNTPAIKSLLRERT